MRACDPMENSHLVSRQLKKNMWPRWAINLSPWYGHLILVSRYLFLTGVKWLQHRRQISEKYTVNQGYMSLLSYYLDYVRYVTGLPHRHRRRAYLPKSNTASHDNDKKINSWVSFCFPYGYGAPLGSRSTNRSELRYKLHMCEPVKI